MIDLLGLTTEEIKSVITDKLGQPAYRGKQVAEWLYRRIAPGQGGGAAADFAAMTDLPANLRGQLAEHFRLQPLTESGFQRDSRDGTVKVVAALDDGPHIESVLMPDERRVSVCLSSQAGCPMGCVFCATGTQGLARNLTAGEIVAQFLMLQARSERRISHVVFMGMGEPLLNYDALLKAIRILTHEVGLSMRHITVSTVGILPAIEKLAAEDLPLTLAVSLHAPNDELRRRIVPVHRTYTVDGLMDVSRRYFLATKRRITFEYILLKDVNDRPEEARQLAALLKGYPSAVNLIPYNPTSVTERFERPEPSRVQAFRRILEASGATVTQRKERGQEIAAACGQLVTETYKPARGIQSLAMLAETDEPAIEGLALSTAEAG